MKKSLGSRKKEAPQLSYVQYDATGNRFALMVNRDGAIRDAAGLAGNICRELEVDGLLIMEDSASADARMRIVNPDGSEVSMCGNGSRCAAHWAHHDRGLPNPMKLETGAGLLEATVDRDRVKIRLTDPHSFQKQCELEALGRRWEFSRIDTGVPHAVVASDDVASLDVERVGRSIRKAKDFHPQGTNVTFYQLLPGEGIRVRTYERGVEYETLSCGTGATAAALVAADRHGLKSPVRVRTQSGKELLIHFTKVESGWTDVFLEGDVERIGDGVISSS